MELLEKRQLGKPFHLEQVMERVNRFAVVDVGSNSVRMVVFDGAARSPSNFYNEKVTCGLGNSLTKTGKLDEVGKERAIAAIHRFVAIAKMMNVSELVSVGTAALREAQDGQEFCQLIFQETGLEIQVASGIQEAKLAAKGVILGSPDAHGVVSDLGGVSMELAVIVNQKVGKCVSSRLGPLILNKLNLPTEELNEYIHHTIEDLSKKIGKKTPTLFLVGGSWRALARLNIYRTKYPLNVLNEYEIIPEEIDQTLEWFAKESIETINTLTQISISRLQCLELSGRVLNHMIKVFQPSQIKISTCGIREGLIFEKMPRKIQQSDPLIEACLFSEYHSARLPGYGNYLFNFIYPLFEKISKKQKRLIKAVCLLHDVFWSSHPDYRAQICFESATRGNLGGVDHRGRIFIALSLYYRYKNFNNSNPYSNLLTLLNDKEIHLAETVGKAIRFAAMFIVISPESLTKLKFKPKKNNLILQIPRSHTPILGEAATARFNALAKSMQCNSEIKIQ